jgi:hypothetical protein
MATYNSSNITTNAPLAYHGENAGVQYARATVSCAAAPTTADTLNFFYLPANARVLGGYLSATDMDTNGTPTITLNIGDAGSANRFFAASTVAQTGSAALEQAVTGLDYKPAAKTLVTGVAAANAATGAAGSVTLTLLYAVED